MCSCWGTCCRYLGHIIHKILFLILPSLLDLSTDILNALDMIFAGSWGQSSKGTIFERFLNICSGRNYNNKAFQRKTCGYISLALVFLPGIVKAINVLVKHVKNKDYHKIPKIVIYLPYPLYIFYIQLKAICRPNSAKHHNSLIRALSMEAFYESFPQLVLQLITFIYKYPNPLIQWASVTFSFIMLVKTVMVLDNSKPKFYEKTSKTSKMRLRTPSTVETEQKDEPGCCTKACGHLMRGMKYIFWIMPLYITSVVYKVAAFSLTIAYLRLWSIGTMLLLIVELIILAKCSGLGGSTLSWIYPVFSNFFIVNIGGAYLEVKEKGKEIKNTNILYKFAKRSVILSFIHHTLVLTAIIWLVLEVGGEDLGYLISNENGETVSSLKNFL